METGTPTTWEGLSDVLYRLGTNDVVQHYRDNAVWEMAVIENVAHLASVGQLSPRAVELMTSFLTEDGGRLMSKHRQALERYLDAPPGQA